MSVSQPRCLVCEDQALIGLALESYLEEVGIGVVGPFASCEAALAWAKTGTPEFAILDYKFRDGSCTKLAQVLRQRGVPVVIYSGWQRRDADVPDALADVPWLEKPSDRAELLAVLMGAALSSSALAPA